MTLSVAQPMIYMVDSQSATLASMRPLLEASGRPVMAVDDPDAFSHDVLSHRTVRECDAIILDLEGGQAPIYRLLNLVMSESERPRIVLMAGENAPLGNTDSFVQSRLHVLHHPMTPRALLDILDKD